MQKRAEESLQELQKTVLSLTPNLVEREGQTVKNIQQNYTRKARPSRCKNTSGILPEDGDNVFFIHDSLLILFRDLISATIAHVI